MARTITLDRRVTLQEKTLTDEGGGATTESWSDVGDFWANVKALEGAEYYRAQQTQSSTDYEVTLRRAPSGAPNPTAAMRIQWRGQVLEITSARPTEGDNYWLLMCTKADER